MRRSMAVVVVAVAHAAVALAAPAAPAQRTAIVKLKSQAELGQAGREKLVAALRAHSRESLRALEALLGERKMQGKVSALIPLWSINAFSLTATEEVLAELSARPEVLSVTPDEIFVVPTSLPPEPNLVSVKAPGLWALGAQGQGVVIASLDSGVDLSHPELAGRWRGGASGWFDPYGQHATPFDLSGHGTWTMGVMLGGNSLTTAIGIAPGARWIAAKIFNDQGRATATAIHLAFQWVLDPDGDPTTDDAPQVVNGSWSFGAPGCNPEFQPDLQALRTAGIVSVFSGGNAGPGANSSTSPGNYPHAFSVGSVDLTGASAWDSSRGPSACDGSLFPTVVAPGVDIVTTDKFGGYASVSGTSIAAPHVSGVFALLRSAFPAASVSELETALVGSATDLGPPGPDNKFGHGLIDAVAACGLLSSSPRPRPPVAVDDAYWLTEDTSATFSRPGLLGNDRSLTGRPLSVVLVDRPQHGQLVVQPDGALSYTPLHDFNGVDLFTYRALDGAELSELATVTLRVAEVNDRPTAVQDRVIITRIAPVKLDVTNNDFDVDGRVVPGSIEILEPPRKGSVTIAPHGRLIYAPRRGFVGSDVFTYAVSDERGAKSNPGIVHVEKR